MYLNKVKIWTGRILYILALLPCAGASAILLLYMQLIVTNQVSVRAEDVSITSTILGAFLFGTIVFYRKLRNILHAEKMNRFFEEDEDGLVAIADVAKYMNMEQKKCFSFFIDCVGKGILENCMIFQEDPTYILLENGRNKIHEKFIVLHCNSCGAPNTLRIGFENSCKYCGAVLTAHPSANDEHIGM